MKKFIAIVLVFFMALAFVGCKNSDVFPESLTIKNAPTSMTVGEKVTVTLTFSPTDVTSKNVEWKSSDTSILLVTATSSKVSIEAVGEGTATITVSSKDVSGVSAFVEITVVPAEKIYPTSIAIVGATVVKKGESTVLTIKYTPSSTTEKDVVWSSSDSSVATVDDNGTVSAIENGSVTITAKAKNDENVSDSFNITVNEIGAIAVESLEITGTNEMVINNIFALKVTATPSNASFSASWSSSDESVATVDEKGKVSALKIGSCVITLTAEGTGVSTTFDVTVIDTPDLTGISITGAHGIEIGEYCNLGISETPEYALYNVAWTSSNSSVATIDVDGKVTGIATGTVTITATEATTSLTATTEIEVSAAFDPNAKPIEIQVTGPEKVYVGYNYNYIADVLPAGVNQSVTWTSSNATVGTIDDTGKFTALAAGTTRIRAISTVETSVKSSFVLITVEEVDGGTTLDLQGYNIIMMNAASALTDINPFLDGYSGSDKTYKQEAWRKVENDFNCKITVSAYPDTAPWGPQRINWLIDNATNGTSQTDFAVVSAAWLTNFAQASALVDCTTYFGKYGYNQIEAAMKEASTYDGKMYAVSTGCAETKTYVIQGLFYNYGLVQKYGLTSPAKLFNDGEWTYSKFVEYCKEAQALLGEGEYVMSGGPSLVWAGMVEASGVKIADKVTMTLNLKHQYSYDAITALTEIISAGAWDIDNIDYDEKVAAFQGGYAIFQPGEYWFVRSANRFPENLWGEGSTFYGYVPFPYSDSITKEQTKVNYVGDSIIVMPAARSYPANVTAEGIYCAMQAMYLNTVKLQKADPSYDPAAIKENSMLKRIDDPESVEATIFFTADKTMFDPIFDESFQYSWSGETTTAVINAVKGGDAAEEFEAIYSAVDTKFKQIYG